MPTNYHAAFIDNDLAFRTLADSIPLLCWMANADGWIFWYNSRWYEYTGTTPEAMEGWGWQSVHDPQRLPEVMTTWQHSIATGESFNMIFPLRGADGVFRPFLTRIHPFRDGQGQIIRWFGTNTEVTEIHEVQQQLHSTEERYRLALKATNDAVWDWNILTDEVTWNEASATLFGWTDLQANSTGAWWESRIHPDDRPRVMQGIMAAQQQNGCERWSEEYRLECGDGHYAEVLDRGFVLRDEHGKAIRMIGAMQDQTEQKRMIQALRENQQQLRTLTESMPQMVWSTLPDGPCDFFSSQWYDYTGTEPGNLDGFNWLEWFHPDDRAETMKRWRHSLETGDTFEIEYRLRNKDGLYRWFLGRGMPVRNEQGPIIRWYGTCTDIHEVVEAREALASYQAQLERQVAQRTQELLAANEQLQQEILERERAERALAQAQKMEAIGQLTGGLAHDFNNLLTVILGNVDLALHQVQGDPRLERYLNLIVAATEKGKKLNQQLLAFSRRQALEAKIINLNDVVKGLHDLVSKTLGANIHFDMKLAYGLWNVSIDPVQLELALINILVNARDAMPPEGGTVVIETKNIHLTVEDVQQYPGLLPGHYVQLSITDDGSGMSPDVLAHVTEPFFTTKEVGRGTGLGLSQVYGFVRQSRGHFNIYSEKDLGTTVLMHYPALTDQLTSAEAPASETMTMSRKGKGGTILVVEDNPDVLEIALDVLTGHGFKVIAAHDARTALEYLGQHAATIDLLFSDIAMPGGMNGLTLATQVREQYPEIEILLATGFANELIWKEQPVGFQVMQKPYRPSELVRVIRELLNK